MKEKRRRDRSDPTSNDPGSDEANLRSVSGTFVQRLGEADCGAEDARIGFLNLMANSGDSVPDGRVLTHELHLRFLETSGIARVVRASTTASGDIRRRVRELQRDFRENPLNTDINRVVCDAVLALNARTVVVISEDVSYSGLGSIPQAQEAVVKAWLSVDGLKRQIRAAGSGEQLPTWAVLVQREIREITA